jgi:hypothetical protein
LQLRKAAAVTTIQLKRTRVRKFQMDSFRFQSNLVLKGACKVSRLMDGTSAMSFSGRNSIRFETRGGIREDRFRAEVQGKGMVETVTSTLWVAIAVRVQWSFSTENFWAIFKECTPLVSRDCTAAFP